MSPFDPRAPLPAAGVRDLFPGTADVVYLNTASMALGATPVRAAYEGAVAEWSAGRFDFAAAEAAGEEARAAFARLVGAGAHEIALVPTVSGAAGLVAAQLPPARPGESVVVGAEEYTSNYFPWVALADRGYDVRTVPFVDGAPPTEALVARVDAGTRLLAVGAVQSSSGRAAELPALAEAVHRHGGWLFVDASQAVGAVPLDVRALGIDFLATPSHKFLLGTRGMGYLYVREGLVPAMRPTAPGWKAAREPLRSFYGPTVALSETASRLDASLAWFAALADRAALGIFARFGAEALFERNAGLVRHLRACLRDRGVEVEAPDAPVRSTVLSFAVADADALLRRLAEARIVASPRAGRVRVSVHVHNAPHELDRLADLIADSVT